MPPAGVVVLFLSVLIAIGTALVPVATVIMPGVAVDVSPTAIALSLVVSRTVPAGVAV